MIKLFIMLDVIIPFHQKDVSTLPNVVHSLKKNVYDIGQIYIIGVNDPQIKNTVFVFETEFQRFPPIEEYYRIHKYRIGWIFQQLIKLTAWKVITNLTDNYLVWDSDTILYKPMSFMNDDKFLFGKSYDIHEPYFQHISRVLPMIKKRLEFSGICHYQIFNKSYLKELFELVQEIHEGISFEIVFLSMLDENEKACCSEYELYANFMVNYHNDKVIFRDVKSISYATWDFNHIFETEIVPSDIEMASFHKYQDI